MVLIQLEFPQTALGGSLIIGRILMQIQESQKQDVLGEWVNEKSDHESPDWLAKSHMQKM